MKRALQGLYEALRHERNFRIHLGVGVLVVLVGIAIGLGPIQWVGVVVAMMSVLTAELLNTAVEHLADLIHHRLSHNVEVLKNVSAGAVLVSAVGSVVIALLTVWDRFQ